MTVASPAGSLVYNHDISAKAEAALYTAAKISFRIALVAVEEELDGGSGLLLEVLSA